MGYNPFSQPQRPPAHVVTNVATSVSGYALVTCGLARPRNVHVDFDHDGKAGSGPAMVQVVGVSNNHVAVLFSQPTSGVGPGIHFHAGVGSTDGYSGGRLLIWAEGD